MSINIYLHSSEQNEELQEAGSHQAESKYLKIFSMLTENLIKVVCKMWMCLNWIQLSCRGDNDIEVKDINSQEKKQNLTAKNSEWCS